MVKKRNLKNPFKLWGSYVGLIITFFVIPNIIVPSTTRAGTTLGIGFFKMPFFLLDTYWTFNQFIVYMIILPIVGFLIGWLIHKNIIKR